MEAVAAFVASQNLILWGFGLIVVVGLLGAILPWFLKTRDEWEFYYQNWEIFDRQNKMEAWLKEQFTELGIKVTFNRSEYAHSYKNMVGVLAESNLFFSAEDFDYEKVKAYKRIMGVVMNKFPWIKVGAEQNFSPYRLLDRAWAKEYAVEKYAHPVYGAPCKCGCNNACLVDFEWRSLKETPEDEVILDPHFNPERQERRFNCGQLGIGSHINTFRGGEHLYARESPAELTADQVTRLNAEAKKVEDKIAEDARLDEERRRYYMSSRERL